MCLKGKFLSMRSLYKADRVGSIRKKKVKCKRKWSLVKSLGLGEENEILLHALKRIVFFRGNCRNSWLLELAENYSCRSLVVGNKWYLVCCKVVHLSMANINSYLNINRIFLQIDSWPKLTPWQMKGLNNWGALSWENRNLKTDTYNSCSNN